MQPSAGDAPPPAPTTGIEPAAMSRNTAVDAYRGLVMLLMMAEVLRLSSVARAFPGNRFWEFLAFNQSHVEWAGCSLHDMIQPSFSFLVGVALPYSIARRMAKGSSFGGMMVHTLWRSVLLVWLGIFLRSQRGPIPNFTFEDTLTQIGLGYTFLFALWAVVSLYGQFLDMPTHTFSWVAALIQALIAVGFFVADRSSMSKSAS